MADSQWLVIELTEQGESADYRELENAIIEIFGNIDFFIPIYHEEIGSYISTCTLFEGYIFIKDLPKNRDKVDEVKNNRFFSKILGSKTKFYSVDSKVVESLREKLQNSVKKILKPGTYVEILEGIFQNLLGEVIGVEDDGKRVMVKIKTLSREIITPIPSTEVREFE